MLLEVDESGAFSRLKLHPRHKGARRGGGKTPRRISGCPCVASERGGVGDSTAAGAVPALPFPGDVGRQARSSSSAPQGCQLPVKPETRGLAQRGRPGPSAGERTTHRTLSITLARRRGSRGTAAAPVGWWRPRPRTGRLSGGGRGQEEKLVSFILVSAAGRRSAGGGAERAPSRRRVHGGAGRPSVRAAAPGEYGGAGHRRGTGTQLLPVSLQAAPCAAGSLQRYTLPNRLRVRWFQGCGLCGAHLTTC